MHFMAYFVLWYLRFVCGWVATIHSLDDTAVAFAMSS